MPLIQITESMRYMLLENRRTKIKKGATLIESKEMLKGTQKKNPLHKNIRWLMCNAAIHNGGYIIEPIILCPTFFEFLQENHRGTKNTETARTMSKVFSTLCHVFYIAGEKLKHKSFEVNDFFVAQSIWEKVGVKKEALATSINYLKEMGLISFRNKCVNNDPHNRKRFFTINLQALTDFMSALPNMGWEQDEDTLAENMRQNTYRQYKKYSKDKPKKTV